MKKLKLFVGIASFALLAACNNSETETVETQEPTTEVAPVETESSTTQTTTTTTTNDDGTEVKVTETGVEVGTKKGGSSTEVQVSKDSISFKKK